MLATYAYDNLGNRTSVTFGNGVVQNFTWDPVARLASLTNNLSGTASDLTKTFAYNPASQITTETKSNDAYAMVKANVSETGTSNGLNQLTTYAGKNLTHDARGNVTAFGTDTFAYSSENMLTSATVSGTATALSYDPMLRLYQTTSGATVTRFGYDGLQMIAEYDAGNALQRRFVFGPGLDDPIVQYEGTDTPDRRFLSKDERGSIISVSDSSGAVLAINRYDEYGIPSFGALANQRFGYTGQAWLPSAQLWHYKARVYAPHIGGRFLQADPIGYGSGLNLYAYVGNDPVNFVDPLGLSPDIIVTGIRPVAIDPILITLMLAGGAVIGSAGASGQGVSGSASPANTQEQQKKKQEEKDKKTRQQCLINAFEKNKAALALDAGGWVVALSPPSVVVSIIGSVFGAAGIGVSVANRDPAAGAIAYGSKQSSVASGLLQGPAGQVARRFGLLAVAASTAYDLSQVKNDYEACVAASD